MMQACDRCHRRKQGCDKRQPCAGCQKVEATCTYSDRTRERTFRAEHVERIERRLRQAEARNRSLSQQLSTIRDSRRESSTVVQQSPSTAEVDDARTQPALESAPRGDITSEVSYLAINAGGERQYLGSASGILFADLVRAGVGISASDNSSRTAGLSHHLRRNLHQQSERNTDLSTELPPEDLARQLVDAYLRHDHLCYPFLLPSMLLKIVDDIYSFPGYSASHQFETFVFDMILAISTTHVYKYDWQMLPSAESHHARAMGMIGDILRKGGLRSLQALLLLCQYRAGSSIQDTSASMWHLVGIAARMCFEYGLHRESAYPLKRQADELAPEKLAQYQEQELQRRCFWSVVAMDRVVSIILGRPLAIREDDVDTNLPGEDDCEAFYASNTADRAELEGHEKTRVFCHIVKYRLLCGQIMLALHGKRKVGDNESTIRELRDQLDRDLDFWISQTETLHLPGADSPPGASKPFSSFLSREWYDILYHNAKLMLFRPSPVLSDICKDPVTLQHIFDSSKQAITLYASLHKSRKINYSWVTLQSVFMAGLSYIYSVSRHFRERRRQPPETVGSFLSRDPGAVEIVNDTRACSNVLVAVSERWNALRHCHEVFDRLSDAVLADSIKMHNWPAFGQNSNQLGSLANSQWPQYQQRTAECTPSSDNLSQTTWQISGVSMPGELHYTSLSPLAVDNEFRSCFDDLQGLYYQQQANNPVLQLSQDWLGYLGAYESTPSMPNQDDHSMTTDMVSILN